MAFYVYYRYSPSSCHDGIAPGVGGGMMNVVANPSIRAGGAEVGPTKVPSFSVHKLHTFAGCSKLSANGARGYDYEPYLRSHDQLSSSSCQDVRV